MPSSVITRNLYVSIRCGVDPFVGCAWYSAVFATSEITSVGRVIAPVVGCTRFSEISRPSSAVPVSFDGAEMSPK